MAAGALELGISGASPDDSLNAPCSCRAQLAVVLWGMKSETFRLFLLIS